MNRITIHVLSLTRPLPMANVGKARGTQDPWEESSCSTNKKKVDPFVSFFAYRNT